MQKDRVLITKDLIPYSFNILLADELFTLTVDYNEKHDFFTVALEKDGEMICEGEPIVYGFPLFADMYDPETYPCIDIIPLDESGKEKAVSFENFNETVFLTVDNYLDESGEDIE